MTNVVENILNDYTIHSAAKMNVLAGIIDEINTETAPLADWELAQLCDAEEALAEMKVSCASDVVWDHYSKIYMPN